jgi:hypothetical protein
MTSLVVIVQTTSKMQVISDVVFYFGENASQVSLYELRSLLSTVPPMEHCLIGEREMDGARNVKEALSSQSALMADGIEGPVS